MVEEWSRMVPYGWNGRNGWNGRDGQNGWNGRNGRMAEWLSGIMAD